MNDTNNKDESPQQNPEKEPLVSETIVEQASQIEQLRSDSELQAESEKALTFEEESRADILFPLEQLEKKIKKRKKIAFSVLRVFLLFGLLAGTFLLGFGTQPEVLDKLTRDGKHLLNLGMEKAKPIADMLYEKADEMVDNFQGTKSNNPSSSGETAKKVKYWKAPMTPGFTSDKPGKSPMGMDLIPVYEEVKTEKKVKYWKAPMTPGYTSDKPGKSPMGMDMVPVYENDTSVKGVSINPVMVQNIGVKTQIVKTMALSRKIRTVGRLTYDERLVTHLHTKFGGWVDKLYVDFTGEKVKKNDVLMEIYSPELVTTQEELLLALKYYESLKKSSFQEISRGAKNLYDSTLRRLQLFDVPEHQINELIESKKVTKTLHIHSPVDGYVIKKNVLQGMFVKPGMNLYMIADLSNIWIIADIYEYEVPWVKMGQNAEMTLSYFPGKTFKGKVTFIDPVLDAKSRTLKVRIEFPNPDGELKPEMYANVTLKSAVIKKGVAVPEEAVIYTGENRIVLVQNSTGGFESRKLTLGVETEGYVQVLKGLKAGERVVTSSTFLIDSESRLKEALEKMQSPKKSQPNDKPKSKNKSPSNSKPMKMSMPMPKAPAGAGKTEHKMQLKLKEAPSKHTGHKTN